MAKSPKLPSNIPPRGLTICQAAEYWGCSHNTFKKLVRNGVVPAPIRLEIGRNIYDRLALDAAMDALRSSEMAAG